MKKSRPKVKKLEKVQRYFRKIETITKTKTKISVTAKISPFGKL